MLSQEIVAKITAVENAFGSYTGIFRSVSSPDELVEQGKDHVALQSSFQGLERAMDACFGTKPLVLLLNDREVSAHFDLYLQELFGFQRYARPESMLSLIEMHNKFEAVSQRRTAVLCRLSDVYLN